MTKIYLTPDGKRRLEEKLVYLRTVKRPEVIKQIGIAREFGDLSENSEYDAAKDEQAAVEAAIIETEETLRQCEIIDTNKLNLEHVSVGATVIFYDMKFNEEIEYRIAGSTEMDPLHGVISNESPLGRASIGHKVGDIITVTTFAGPLEYKIRAIKA